MSTSKLNPPESSPLLVAPVMGSLGATPSRHTLAALALHLVATNLVKLFIVRLVEMLLTERCRCLYTSMASFLCASYEKTQNP